MERVPPGDLPPAYLEREREWIYRMMKCWDGPRYPGSSTYSLRLRSFGKSSWPHPKRSPNSFSAAGFFYTGKDLCIRAAKTNIKSVLIHCTLHHPISIYLSFISLQGTLMKHGVSIVAGGWRDDSFMTMTQSRSIQNGSRSASTFVTWWKGMQNIQMMISTWRSINIL